MEFNEALADILTKLAAPFPQESIHWRAQTVSRNGNKALALAYLDARDVMERLDTMCPHGWESEHYDCGSGRMGCKIGIWITPDRILWRSDGAGATQVEAEKGAFSDALKRAAVSWGIGRYLYDLGNTWVPCEAKENGKDNYGNTKWRFVKFNDDPWRHTRQTQAKETEAEIKQKTRNWVDGLKKSFTEAPHETAIDALWEQKIVDIRKLGKRFDDLHKELVDHVENCRNSMKEPA